MKFLPTMKSLKAFAVAAFAGAAMFGGTAEAQQIDWSYLNDSPVRFEAGGVSGNQPGVQRGYYRTGAFMSIIQDQNSILFLDGHGNVNYDSGNWSGNVGVGYRRDMGGMVLGGNAYYNYREYTNGVTEHNFSTISFGAEALMSDWAVRSNAYFSLNGRESNGLTQFALPGGPDYVPQMSGSVGVSNIRLATQTENFDESLDIFDLNVSRKIPAARSEVGAGVYYMSAGSGPDTWGVNGTAETWLTPNVAGNVTVSHDDLFDTTLYGGVSVYFGGPAIDVTSRAQSVKSRLWSRTQRRSVVPVLNYTTAAPDLLAHNPDTGDLITVAQIGMTGDLLGAPNLLEDDGEFIDIILVDPGTAFALGDTLALNDDQRLLSGDIFHDVDTLEFGTIQLPETLLGGGPAMLMGADGFDVITLANNNEISGFDITGGAMARAITGTDVTGFNINNNTITAPGGRGIGIESLGLASVSGSLANNTITNSSGDGILLRGVDAAVDFTDNIVSDNGNDNIDIELTGDFSGMIARNVLSGALNGDGFDFNAITISGSIVDNIANGNDLNGLSVVVESVAMGSTLNVTGNTANLNVNDGISLIFTGTADSNIFVDGNTADSNMGDGISIVSNGMGDILGTISNNTTNNNDPGIFVQSNDVASNLILDIIGNVANNNTMEGIFVDAINDFTGEVSGNTTSSNGDDGLAISADNNLSGLITANTSNLNGGDGFSLIADNNSSGSGNMSATITNNMAIANTDTGFFIGGFDVTGNITGNTGSNTTGGDGFNIIADNNVSGLFGNNTANGNSDNGITIHADNDGNNMGDMIAIVSNNTAGIMGSGNGANGIFIEGENIAGGITGNTAGFNMDAGISVNAVNNATIGGVTGNTTSNNGGTGLGIIVGNDFSGGLSSNVSNSNGGTGISIAATGNFSGDISGNTTSGNMVDGIFLTAGGSILGTNAGNGIRNNTANSNGASGIAIDGGTIGTAMNSFVISGNTTGMDAMTGNGDDGIKIAASVGSAFLTITNNTSSNNMFNGFQIDAIDDITGIINGNTSNNNGATNLLLNFGNGIGDVNVDITNNIANGSTFFSGITVRGDNFLGDVFGNTANDNLVDGFDFVIITNFTGDFMNNTATNNTSFDYNTTAGGAVTGTVTPNTSTTNNAAEFNGNIATP